MSQKVSPILFNTTLYNNSKWFNKNINKYSLNEDLQIREIVDIIFKNNVNFQFLFIDKVVIYKYFSKFKIYIYFFCNFKYLKKNITESKNFNNKKYINFIYIYYKYNEILNQRKIEIIKLLYFLKHKDYNVYIYFKNLNKFYNSKTLIRKKYMLRKYKNIYMKNFRGIKKRGRILQKIEKRKNYKFKNPYNYLYIYYNKKKYLKQLSKNKKKNKYKTNIYSKPFKKKFRVARYFYNLKYYKTMHFVLYNLCFNHRFLNKITASSLLNMLYFELDSVNNAAKNYNFLFYNNFNLMREYLTRCLKNDNCQLKGIRIKVKGRFFLTKRKRVFTFNLGELNLNRIDKNKDYHCLHLIKSTGSSSLKIWVNYK